MEEGKSLYFCPWVLSLTKRAFRRDEVLVLKKVCVSSRPYVSFSGSGRLPPSALLYHREKETRREPCLLPFTPQPLSLPPREKQGGEPRPLHCTLEKHGQRGPALAVPTLAVPTLATPTLAAPTLAAPTLSGPSLAGPILAGPTRAGPNLARPNLAGPIITGPTLAGQTLVVISR